MNITLDQARAFVAFDKKGTLAGAGKALGKSHSAVLHAHRGLERETGLVLFDRGEHRLRLTPTGRRVLAKCEALLAAEDDLEAACAELRTGWEPSLRVVYDGIFPDAVVLGAVREVVARGAPTRLHVSSEFLGGVEDAFDRDEADLMIAVLPARQGGVVASRLAPLRVVLVAHRKHPLARRAGPLDDAALDEHALVTVRGSDPRLSLPTAGLERRVTIDLNDFHGKRTAILSGLGYGWLPEGLCRDDLARRRLVRLDYRRGSEHVLQPRLYHRAGVQLGPAARMLVSSLRATV